MWYNRVVAVWMLAWLSNEKPEDQIRMPFEIISEIGQLETIASNTGIREVRRLRRSYGSGRWRKRKGIATVLLPDGTAHQAELHWYEADGIGRKEIKLKHLLD